MFISHANEDRELVEKALVTPLKEAGHETWYSTENIRPAAQWERAIHSALESCDWFLLAMTQAASQSKWVQTEVHWATEHRWGRIVPVLFEDCEPASFHIRIPQIQHVDLREGGAAAKRRLLASLEPEEPLSGDISEAQLSDAESARTKPTLSAPRRHFHCGPWVPAAYFIGREEQLSEARDLIASHQSFLIVGHPRAGKTSLCRKLEGEFDASSNADTLVSYLNLQQCSELTLETFMEHTILNIAGEIARTVFHCRYMDLRKPSPAEAYPQLQDDRVFDSFVDLYRHVRELTHTSEGTASRTLTTHEFVDLTRDLLEIAKEKGRNGFVIFYDEANRLPLDISGDVLLALAETLNETGVNGGYVASPEMENHFERIDPLFGGRIVIGPFPSMETMKKLLARYYFDDAEAAANLPVSDQALQSLWRFSEGVPFLIQLIGDYGFRVARKRRSDILAADHIEEANTTARNERPAAFRYSQ